MTKDQEKRLDLMMRGHGASYKKLSELESLIMRKELQIVVLKSKDYDCTKKESFIKVLADRHCIMISELAIANKLIMDFIKKFGDDMVSTQKGPEDLHAGETGSLFKMASTI